jgi:methionyl-tRNA formyltransferase
MPPPSQYREAIDMRTAVIMCGVPIHGRMLIESMIKAGLSPDLIISEQDTARAAKIEAFLANNAFDNARALPELLEMGKSAFLPVDDFASENTMQALADLDPAYIICGGCGIVREPLLSAARIGLLNAHPGLLPAFRGLDPVLWSVAHEATVGATLHFVTAGIDEGDVLISRGLAWRGARELVECRLQCMRHGADLLSEFLAAPENYPPQSQNEPDSGYFSVFPEEKLRPTEEKLRSYVPDSKFGNRYQKALFC